MPEIFGIDFNNKEQDEFARLIKENKKQIIFCEGPAGTGKNFCAIATALDLEDEKKVKTIYYVRDPVQMGAQIGYLKGSMDDKLKPFSMPIYDTLDAICENSNYRLNTAELEKHIKVIPLFAMRGRSLGSSNTILIADEMQNCDLNTIKTLITRIGRYGKIVLMGSNKQIDNPKIRKQEKSDFQIAYEALEGLPYVGVIHLTRSMRAPWTAEVDEILTEAEKAKEKAH